KATKARQVQSRVKMLEKIEIIEVEDEDEEIHFNFPQPSPSGAIVMELKNINKSYGTKHVFTGLNYTIERGDKIAIVGVNGAGKSTFSRIVAGVEPFDRGERKTGYNVILSYFAQHQAEELDLSKEALQIVDEVAQGEIRTKLRTILGSFLFHGDDVFKKVSVLSGGEKSRLALAKMLLQPANFLIMDEPTNHLDMRSKKVLQEALLKYEGTYIIVSHDRAFLDPIVNKVLEFSHSGVRTFLGNVSEYLERKRSEQDAQRGRGVEERGSGGAEGLRSGGAGEQRGGEAKVLTSNNLPLTEKERRRLEAEARQALSKKLKPFKEKLEKTEKEIETLEVRKKEIEALMGDADFYKNGEEAKRVSHEYGELKMKLEYSYAMWERVTEEIEEIKNDRI
ncbi:MAG: ATP-binding cassette domain-containing protein, partial [Bacteroidetes bacterium]